MPTGGLTLEHQLPINQVVQGDSLQVLRTFPDNCIDFIFTSPPYFHLRDYGVEGQIGKENSLQKYLDNLFAIMDECWRVLKPTGTLYVNIGDTFAGSGGAGGDYDAGGIREGQPRYRQELTDSFKPKSLILVPEEFVTGMRCRGWIVRGKPFWYKPNGMIDPSRDRPKLDYEPVYMFTKQQEYWFNYVEAKKPIAPATAKRMKHGLTMSEHFRALHDTGYDVKHFSPPKIGGEKQANHNGNRIYSSNEYGHDLMAKIGSYWKIQPESIWSLAPKSFGHEYCEHCDILVKSRHLMFKCVDNAKTGTKGCGTVYKRLSSAEMLKANNLDPDMKCLVCGRSLKRHVSLNSQDRADGIKPEVVDCGFFDLPDLQVRGCPKCGNERRDPVCPKCHTRVHMHHAMFPEELVQLAMRMSCPNEVCSKCGVPRFPIYTPTEEYKKLLGKGWHEHIDDEVQGQMQEKVIPAAIAKYLISGWTDCGCGAPFIAPVCLDPFAGFNTVGAVAMKNGKNFIGIELDPRNVKAGMKRVEEMQLSKKRKVKVGLNQARLI